MPSFICMLACPGTITPRCTIQCLFDSRRGLDQVSLKKKKKNNSDCRLLGVATRTCWLSIVWILYPLLYSVLSWIDRSEWSLWSCEQWMEATETPNGLSLFGSLQRQELNASRKWSSTCCKAPPSSPILRLLVNPRTLFMLIVHQLASANCCVGHAAHSCQGFTKSDTLHTPIGLERRQFWGWGGGSGVLCNSAGCPQLTGDYTLKIAHLSVRLFAQTEITPWFSRSVTVGLWNGWLSYLYVTLLSPALFLLCLCCYCVFSTSTGGDLCFHTIVLYGVVVHYRDCCELIHPLSLTLSGSAEYPPFHLHCNWLVKLVCMTWRKSTVPLLLPLPPRYV